MNGTQINHYADGFGRYSIFKIKDGKVTFSTKMLNSRYYEQSKNEGNVVPGLLFTETTPPRWKSSVPMMNLLYTRNHNDNNWVDLEMTADGKDFLVTFDSDLKLKFDIDTLE